MKAEALAGHCYTNAHLPLHWGSQSSVSCQSTPLAWLFPQESWTVIWKCWPAVLILSAFESFLNWCPEDPFTQMILVSITQVPHLGAGSLNRVTPTPLCWRIWLSLGTLSCSDWTSCLFCLALKCIHFFPNAWPGFPCLRLRMSYSLKNSFALYNFTVCGIPSLHLFTLSAVLK